MLRGDAGRIPFSIIAVLLLLSVGWSAILLANLAHEDAAREMQQARLDALRRVADLVEGEIASHAEFLALGAVAEGTDGWINESRVDEAFRSAFAAYLGERFPRLVRGVRVDVEAHDASVRLLSRRMVDVLPRNGTRVERILDVPVAVPDPIAGPSRGEVDHLAYPAVVGSANLTLTYEGVTLRRSASLLRVLPVPAALMEARLEAATRAGTGDLSGLGRTVKAIVATLVQFRVLAGWASAAASGTTTGDVLTVADVELAVNLAMLLEEVRLFRSFDREAADALDAVRGALPPIPDGLEPSAPGRTLTRLLERYARDGTLDPVDLFAVYTGLDAQGLPLGPVLAQAIAAIADDLALKHLDYLGLTPLADWLVEYGGGMANAFDDFLRWLTGRPSRQAEFVHQYVRAVFGSAGVGTAFFGPASVPIPERAYDVPNGTGSVRIVTPAQSATVPFPWKDLLAREFDGFWEAYFPRFNASAGRVHGSLRGLVNDVAVRVADDAVLAGLLPGSATGPVDPKDNVTFLDALAARVARAVDDAVAWFQGHPEAVDGLMANLWDATKATLADLVAHVRVNYPALAGESSEIPKARAAIADDLFAWAKADPAFPGLNATQRLWLRGRIDADVLASGWADAAYESRRQADGRRWDRAVAAMGGTPLPEDPDLRARLREIVVGAGGWLSLARDAVRGLLEESGRAQGVAGLRVAIPTTLDPFRLWDPRRPQDVTAERFTVSHTPRSLRATAGIPSDVPQVGELRVHIVDPADTPPTQGGGNEHFTRPFERSRRPFATRWGVEVRGAVRLTVATADRVLLGPSGPAPASVHAVWPIDASFSVHGYSGWNLTGVAYASSDTFAEDAWELLQEFLRILWDAIAQAAEAVLDLLRAAIEFVMDLLEPLFAFAHRVVQFLTELAAQAVEFLHDLAVQAADALGGIADAFLDAVPPGSVTSVSMYGLTFRAALNGPGGRELDLAVTSGPMTAGIVLHDLEEAGRARSDGPRYDLVATWAVAAGPFRFEAAFDPLLAMQPTAARGSAVWEGTWRVDFEGPVADPYYRVGVSIGIGPIPVPPIGTVDVEIGVRVHLRQDLVRLVQDLIGAALAEAEAELAGEPESWDYVGRLAVAFARRLVANAVAFLDRHPEDLLEISLYVEAQVDAAGGPASAGLALAIAADGRAVRDVLAWVVRNVLAFFENLLNPLAPADYTALPRSVPEHMFVRAAGYFRFGVPKAIARFLPDIPLEVRLAAQVSANVAAVGALFGQDWGRWEVTFGAYLSIPLPMPEALGGIPGVGGTLWFLRGTLRAA